MKIILYSILFYSIISFAQAKVVLILGDSLTEGYGVTQEEAYPALVENMAHAKGYKETKVINGGVSGSTTASGLSRLNWFFKAKPKIVVVALGANDGLRGLKVEKAKSNLQSIIEKCQEKEMTVVLAAIKLPLNYGEEYRLSFEKMFLELKEKYKVHFIPFLLEGVGGKPEFNQADGIHPNAKGQKILAKTVFKYLEPLL